MATKTKQEIIPPKGGWKPHTWYVVDVSYFLGNPIHKSLFFTGFLSKEHPAGYNCVVPLDTPKGASDEISSVRYMKAIKKLISSKEAEALSVIVDKDDE